MLTVLSWFWSQPGGRSSYDASHVNTWAVMVKRHLQMPHRIACVTDTPEGLDPGIEIIVPPREFEAVRIPTWEEWRPQCLRRLSMFRPDAAEIFGSRFVCMDLDCVVSGPLDPLFDHAEEFMIYRGTAPNRRYNGSMMLLTAGARPQVHSLFTPELAARAGERFVGSDQAWISYVLPEEKTWGPEHGVIWWGERGEISPQTRLMFFPGTPKPWDLLSDASERWVAKHYRGRRGGRALVLGYAPTVWAEASAALDTGGFDVVIASPEAAPHWPGEHIVARDDAHAERLVAMMGFEEAVFCGRSVQVSA